MIKKNSNTYKSRYGSKRETKKKIIIIDVRSQIAAQTQQENGIGPNKPNTINLYESGRKNWAYNGFFNS